MTDHNNNNTTIFKPRPKGKYYATSKSTGAPDMDHQLPYHTVYGEDKI